MEPEDVKVFTSKMLQPRRTYKTEKKKNIGKTILKRP